MSLIRPFHSKYSLLFLDEICIQIYRYLSGVEQYTVAVQKGSTLLDLKLYMNTVLHCYEDEQTYILGPHWPVELEEDLALHDLRMNQRKLIVLVHPAPVEHIPLALVNTVNRKGGMLCCLNLENLTDAQIEHLPSWLEYEAGHIQCIDLSATHSRINTLLMIIHKAFPFLHALWSIRLRRTAYATSGIARDDLLKLCKAAQNRVAGRVVVYLDSHVFHNEKRTCGEALFSL